MISRPNERWKRRTQIDNQIMHREIAADGLVAQIGLQRNPADLPLNPSPVQSLGRRECEKSPPNTGFLAIHSLVVG
jgi:hypothetical protein